MALIVKDRVKETTTTTGTGTVTLAGAAVGFQSFAVIGNANTTYYAIVDSATGAWEVGIGTYTSSGTLLSRDTVLESSTGGAKISFGAGAKEVFVTYPADRSVSQADVGTAPNEIPLNQYLGNLAYQDAANIAGQVGLQVGTAAAPSLVSATDTNTGMFFPAADTIAFSEGGAEAMRITDAGNVGIGTSSPAAKLDVNGAYQGAGNIITSVGIIRSPDGSAATPSIQPGVDNDTGFYRPSANTIGFSTAGIEQMRITDAGNVGIGITPNASSKLQVKAAANSNFAVWDSSGTPMILGLTDAGASQSLRIAGFPLTFTGNGGVGAEAMRITSAGNVGIGTNSPSVLLDVSGGLGRIIPSGGSVNTPESGAGTLNVYGASSDISTRTGALRIESFSDLGANVGTGIAFSGRYITSNAASWTFAKIGGYKEVSTSGGAGGYFAVATTSSGGFLTERMRITSTGDLGIGTASPDANLTVNGAASFAAGTALLPSIARAGDLNTGFWFPAADTIAASTAGSERLRVTSTGDVGIGTTAPAFYSGRLTVDGGNLAIASGNRALFWNSGGTGVASIQGVGTNELSFSTSNSFTERMRLDSSGNVGIGTSSPGAKLSVDGSAIFNDSGADVDFRIEGDTNANLFFADASVDAIGIGTASPSASSILDVQSTTKGVRMPNMTTTEKNAIASPAAGLMVYDTTLSKLCVYTTAWETITSV